MKILCGIALALTSLLLSFNADCTTLEVKAKYWMPKFESDVRVDENGIRGTVIDIEEDLGIDTDEEGAIPIEVTLNLGRILGLWFSYTNIELEGRAMVSDQFVFAGNTFTINADIESTLEFSTMEGGLELDLIPTEIIELGPCASGIYFDGKATITDINSSISAEGTLSTVVPAFGAFARINLLNDNLQISGRWLGMTYGDDDYSDLVVEGKYNILANIGVVAGYRRVTVDVQEDNVFVDTELSGFFVGAAISF